MNITIKDKKESNSKESFTVCFGGTEIKQCKVVDGAKGPFISGPAIPPKVEGGKWFNVVYFGNEEQREILEILRGSVLPEIDVNQVGLDEEDTIPF